MSQMPENFVDNRAVDLSVLTYNNGDHADRLEGLSLRTSTGLWYELKPVSETNDHGPTELHDNNTLYPVDLQFGDWARINGRFMEEAKLGIWFMKKWLMERRHFSSGLVAVHNAVISKGDRVTINGRQTGPLDVAWLNKWTEYTPMTPAGSKTGRVSEYGTTYYSARRSVDVFKVMRKSVTPGWE